MTRPVATKVIGYNKKPRHAVVWDPYTLDHGDTPNALVRLPATLQGTVSNKLLFHVFNLFVGRIIWPVRDAAGDASF